MAAGNKESFVVGGVGDTAPPKLCRYLPMTYVLRDISYA